MGLSFHQHLLHTHSPDPSLLPLFSAGETKMNRSQLLPSSSLWWVREVADQLITTNYHNYCEEQKHKVLRKHRGGEVPTQDGGYYRGLARGGDS